MRERLSNLVHGLRGTRVSVDEVWTSPVERAFAEECREERDVVQIGAAKLGGTSSRP
jgi:hypothetical protein